MRFVYTISPCVCLCIHAFYSISPYCYVYVSKLLTLFHHTIFLYIYVSMLLLYFTIFLCLCIQVTSTISLYWYVYVSKLFIPFLMYQNFLLYFTISFLYVYVSTLCTISPCILIVRVMYPYYMLFHHTFLYVYVSMFSLYFTILLCLCIQVTDTISPYVMCLCIHALVLFHHIY